MYQPAQPDSLPRPKAYEEAYARAAQVLGEMRPPDPADLVGRWLPATALGAGGLAQSVKETHQAQDQAPTEDSRLPLLLVVGGDDFDVVRGQQLALQGAARGPSGEPVVGLNVEVSLATDARPERLLLGVTRTDATGLFAGDFPVPSDLAPGAYRLMVLSPGNERYGAAIAR